MRLGDCLVGVMIFEYANSFKSLLILGANS